MTKVDTRRERVKKHPLGHMVSTLVFRPRGPGFETLA